MTSPTGVQHRIQYGRFSATVASVAASLRAFECDAVSLTPGYPDDAVIPFACGIVLVPWPNRVDGGRWMLHGAPQQLDLTEPSRGNAIHGLLRNTAYDLVERSEHALTLGATVWPQHGYPFLLETTVRYELDDEGLRVTHGIRNASDAAAPVAVGAHPFFRFGDVPTEDLVLRVHAATRVEVDERSIPTGTAPADPALRDGVRIGDLALDHAFADLEPVDGVVASLTAPDGRAIQLWQDEQHRWVQVFVTRHYPGQSVAVALEPMTAPANALATGEGLRWVAPGEHWSAAWGVTVRDAGRLSGNEGE